MSTCRGVCGLLSTTALLMIVLVPGAAATEQSTVQPGHQILDLTNDARARAGCPALRLDPVLTRAATGHARDMAGRNFFSHAGSGGEGHIGRALAAGYPSRYVGENIAAGNATEQETFQQWWHSRKHRENILNCRYTEMGIGHAHRGASRYQHYWAQTFGNPRP